ncbi:MAG TPA: potassium channel family protein [Candidatus Limnocylindrales bacterium]|nr:potassium channel family protein [Candidatus Limnocylindrales bacterium]
MQAVGLLEKLGYAHLRHYVGGMADWLENGGPVEKLDETVTIRQPVRHAPLTVARHVSALEILANWPLERLIGFWLGMIVFFGLIYWLAGIGMGWGLHAGNVAVKPDLDGLGTAIYFSFVTALSIGYGDVTPMGALRILAVIEGIAGLLVFGCVISKLVSRRQEELTAEIHRTTFEDRLDRVRTNLHLVFSDLGSVQQLQAEHGVLPDLVLRRLESTVRVFRGELQAVHDLLYRAQITPDEETMESLLANLIICLQGLVDISSLLPNAGTTALSAGLRSIAGLANEICGECVPRSYAPELKESMDQIQELARRIG